MSWRGCRISVVFPTYNERESIRAAILDFASTDVVDEIVVVNNNAAAGTSEEVAEAARHISNGTLVREIHERQQGYGSWGNWGVAKLMEFLFNSTNLTDVGCTMRLIRREALGQLQPEFTIGGSAFGPEMMLLSLLHGLRVIQIPLNYLPRIGVSSVTGDTRKAIVLGLWMIGLVLRYRVRAWVRQVALLKERLQIGDAG